MNSLRSIRKRFAIHPAGCGYEVLITLGSLAVLGLGPLKTRAGPPFTTDDPELGVKYRFIRETTHLPQVGIFPLLELPTGNADLGLGDGHVQAFLPLWLQKSFGSWMMHGGGG